MEGASKSENGQETLRNIWDLHDVRQVHFGNLVLALHCYSGNKKVKYGLVLNHLFQGKQEHGNWKEPQNNNKLLYRKTMSSCYHME